jgi:hypothetical protein
MRPSFEKFVMDAAIYLRLGTIVLDGPPWPKMFEFCDLLGTSYTPGSKIPSVKVQTFWEAHMIWKNLPHGFDVY